MKHSQLKVVLPVTPLLIASVLAIYFLPRLFSNVGWEQLYAFVFAEVITFSLLYVLILMRRKIMHMLPLVTAYIISALVLISLLVLGYGFVQDSLGVMCPQLFGGGMSCVEFYFFPLFFLLFNPAVMISIGALVCLSIAFLVIHKK